MLIMGGYTPPLGGCTPLWRAPPTKTQERHGGGTPPMLRTARGPRVSPRPGAPACPPVPPGPRTPTGHTSKVKNVFRFKIDAKSIPEALATTILILLKFSIDLAHR